MKESLTLLLVAAVWVSPAAAPAADADDDLNTTLQALKARIKDQGNRLAELEDRLSEQRLQAARRKALLSILDEMNVNGAGRPDDFRVYWDNGIRMATQDGRFKVKLGGRLMLDAGWVGGPDLEGDLGQDHEDWVDVRRARLYAAGQLTKTIDFKLQFDFADGDADLKDAYLKFKKVPFLGNITVGHFKEPFSLEELTSSKYITFMERALPNVFSPGRNVGIMAHNAILNQRVTWAVGLFSPHSDDYGDADADGTAALTARVTALPWYENKGERLLHVGFAYSYRNYEDAVRLRARPEAHIANRFVDLGNIDYDQWNLFGAEAALVFGPFSIQSEFIAADCQTGDDHALREPHFWGTTVQASYFLTGEHRAYKTSAGCFDRVKPRKNFREDGGWGAWEIAGRWSYLDLNNGGLHANHPGTMSNWSVGLNWYLNPNVRIMWNYIRSNVDGTNFAAGNGVNGDADIFMMRMQLDF